MAAATTLERSPRSICSGESYGSVRQVVTGSLLAKRGVTLSGQIILGDSIFLMETSRRTHNIISTAVSLPLLAMTAAYHGKADKKGKTDAAFLDEVYAFGMSDYLLALSKGYTITDTEKRAIADAAGCLHRHLRRLLHESRPHHRQTGVQPPVGGGETPERQ